MALLIDNQTDEGFEEAYGKFLEGVAEKAAELIKLPVAVEISLVLTDDIEIQKLNKYYRGIDKPTDVLSFPLLELDPQAPEEWAESLRGNTDPDSGEAVLGDIVISIDRAREQAEEYGHGFERELGFLLVHGILHLSGYDHEGDEEKARAMRCLEEDILKAMNLSR